MITVNITKGDYGYRHSPIVSAFFKQYTMFKDWKMAIGRDNGAIYQNQGWFTMFPLAPDAWSFNLLWSRNPTIIRLDPYLLLTEKPLLTLLEKRTCYATLPAST